MEAKCYKCFHEWNYKGKSKEYITCPNCYYKLRIDKVIVGKLPTHYSQEQPKDDLIRVSFEDGSSILIPKDDHLLKRFQNLKEEKIEEEIEFSLFEEQPINVCKEHNLPAIRYSDIEMKWICKKCNWEITNENINSL